MADFAGLDQRRHVDVLLGGDRLTRRKHQAVPVSRQVHHAHGALFWRFAVDAVNGRIRHAVGQAQHPGDVGGAVAAGHNDVVAGFGIDLLAGFGGQANSTGWLGSIAQRRRGAGAVGGDLEAVQRRIPDADGHAGQRIGDDASHSIEVAYAAKIQPNNSAADAVNGDAKPAIADGLPDGDVGLVFVQQCAIQARLRRLGGPAANVQIGRARALAVVQHGGLVFGRVGAKIEAYRFGGVVLADAFGHVDDVAIAADQQRPERAGGGRLRRHKHIDADQLGNRQAQGRDGHDLVLVELQGHFQHVEHCIALLARQAEKRSEIHPVVVPLIDQLGHAHGLAG